MTGPRTRWTRWPSGRRRVAHVASALATSGVVVCSALLFGACGVVDLLDSAGRCDTLRIIATDRELAVGDSTQLTAVLRDGRNRPVTCIGNQRAQWSSSAPAVVRVEVDGRLWAVSAGVARVRANDGQRTDEVTFTVR